MNWGKLGIFAGGTLFGMAGLKVLKSREAKKVYIQTTAAALRAKEDVMTSVTQIRECADDVLAEAKEINEKRKAETAEESKEEIIENSAE